MLPVQHDAFTAIDQVLGRFEDYIVGAGVDTEEWFGYHPLPAPEFFRNMAVIGRPGISFVDIGSGAGRQLMLAHYLGWQRIVGLEHDPRLAAISRRLIPEAEIIDGDAFAFDCSGFEVIYTYRLCQNLERQALLGQHIYDTADRGALIIYAGADLNLGEYLGESVWKVI